MKRLAFLLTTLLACSAFVTMAQDTTHKELIGRYVFPAGSVVEEVVVSIDNGKLQMTSSAGVSPIEMIKGDSFNIVTFNGYALFKRNDAKKITGVHIDASGYVLDGVKDSATAHLGAFVTPGVKPATITQATNDNSIALFNGIAIADKNLSGRKIVARVAE